MIYELMMPTGKVRKMSFMEILRYSGCMRSTLHRRLNLGVRHWTLLCRGGKIQHWRKLNVRPKHGGEVLRNMIIRMGVPPYDAAVLCSISYKSLMSYLSGGVSMTPDKCKQFAEGLGLSGEERRALMRRAAMDKGYEL